MKLIIDWQPSSFFGWGVYGINLALELARRNIEAMTSHVVRQADIVVDPLRRAALDPFIRRSQLFPLQDRTGATFLHALGNDFLPARAGPPPGRPRIGVTFFEEPPSAEAIERAKSYDLIIAGSSWNEQVLRSYGVSRVRTVIQGVDRSLFHPAPRRGLYPGRFLIFSGGKAEPRKGQDIVVKAFRVFGRRHDDAMLVTAWHSPWPALAQGMDLDLSEFGDWPELQSSSVARSPRVIDVGAVPNGAMASVYRECHVGLFPSRSEGGTNLVAMECIACGIPAIVSANTGHLDLLRLSGARPVRSVPVTGEPDLEEILDQLERAYCGDRGPGEERLPGWDETAGGLIEATGSVTS